MANHLFQAAVQHRHSMTDHHQSPRTLERYLARAATANLLLRGFALSLVFICNVLLARALGAHDYGLYAYALAWMKALTVPATLGVERLLIREVATYRIHCDWSSMRGLLFWTQRAVLIASVGIALAAICASWSVARSITELKTFWLAMTLIPVVTLLRSRQFVLQGLHRTIVAQVPEMIVHPALLIALICGYILGFGGLTAAETMGFNLSAMCFALICAVVISERALPTSVKSSSPTMHSRNWVSSIVPMLLVSGMLAVNSQVPVLVLGAMQNAEAAGILSVAKRLADLTIIPALALSAVLTPTLADLWATKDILGLQRTTIKCARAITIVSLPIALLLLAFGRPLLQIFGTPFVIGTSALGFLCVGQIINMLAGANGVLLVMTGHERDAALITTSCTFLNVFICVVLIPRWGLVGAAIGATASLVIWNFWMVWRVRNRLGIQSTVFARMNTRY